MDAEFEAFARDGREVVVRPNPHLGLMAGPYRCLSLCPEHEVRVMKKRNIFIPT